MTPRPAATLILAREGAGGVEVFLLRRTQLADFAGGAYVFPGGAVDPADHGPEWETLCAGFDDTAASRLLGVERGGLAYWVAAIRECFEEAGILLAFDASGEMLSIDPGGSADRAGEFARLRAELIAGSISFADLCRGSGLSLALGEVAYFSHWITGQGRPRRYDTRFFVAAAPEGQTASHDRGETVDHLWIRPADALERHRRGELELMFPTIKTLEALARFADTRAVLEHARAPRTVAAVTPRIATGRDGERALVPGDYAYAEAGRVDPHGEGIASYEILPGVPVRLSERLRRITAPNPGFMTGPGTNAYLLGSGDEIALIDPGPAIDSHVRVLIEEARGRIRWILVTHTHRDHSPAAAMLRARTGATLLGMPPPEGERQDRTFVPDRVLRHDERISLAGCTLRAIHTPGHASNHLCYLIEEERLLFTGDHMMQGSTVVIDPPDGDMAAYLASLELLRHENLAWLAPGHGFLMDKPQEMIERLLIHRMERENKVIAALREARSARVEDLLPVVYRDVPARMHPVASRSLLAHLIKLAAEARISRSGERWSA